MKKIKLLLILFIAVFTFNLKVYAGASISASSVNVNVGDTFTVRVSISQAAAWNIHVTPSGPVSGCVINNANATDDALDTSKTFSASCTATGVGTITLTLSGDTTSATNGIPVKVSGVARVNVTQPTTKPVTVPTTQPTTKPATTTKSNNDKVTTTKKNDDKVTTTKNNLSTNNKLKSLSVDGFEVTKLNDNSYILTVPNNVGSINIVGTPEDSKSKITGDGKKELNVGENNFEIIVISESGEQNKITLKVTRKDGYYLEDLKTILSDNNINDIDIAISKDTKISKENIDKIKQSKKMVRFNYFDENKNLIYSWIINGRIIGNTNEIISLISFDSEYKEQIYKSSNYADGLYMSFNDENINVNGLRIKLYVGNKFADGKLINVYEYNRNNKSLNLVKEKLTVVEGYIEFELNGSSNYFITMSKINLKNEPLQTKDSKNIFLIIALIELFIIIFFVVFYILKVKAPKKQKEEIETLEEDFESKPIESLDFINESDKKDIN